MKLITILLSFIPRRLPVGVTDFNKFADRIIALSGQFADRDSMTYVIADLILRLKPTDAYMSDRYFVNSMIKAAANQVASQVFHDIRTKQQEALKAAEAAKSQTNSAEATSDQSQVAESVVK